MAELVHDYVVGEFRRKEDNTVIERQVPCSRATSPPGLLVAYRNGSIPESVGAVEVREPFLHEGACVFTCLSVCRRAMTWFRESEHGTISHFPLLEPEERILYPLLTFLHKDLYCSTRDTRRLGYDDAPIGVDGDPEVANTGGFNDLVRRYSPTVPERRKLWAHIAAWYSLMKSALVFTHKVLCLEYYGFLKES